MPLYSRQSQFCCTLSLIPNSGLRSPGSCAIRDSASPCEPVMQGDLTIHAHSLARATAYAAIPPESTASVNNQIPTQDQHKQDVQ